MYDEREVFELIGERLGSTDTERNLAYNIHRRLVENIPEEVWHECRFRYLTDATKDFGLNIKKFKIYSYPIGKAEEFKLIYPRTNLKDLERLGIEFRTIYKFVELECALLELPTSEFIKFDDKVFEHYRKAVLMAYNGVSAVKKEDNVKVSYKN